MTGCPAENTVLDWVEGRLDGDSRQRLAAHVDECAACRSVVAAAAGDAQPARLQPGARVDRYVVLEVVGAGAMGIVYAAWDPDLSRKVALKLLRTDALAHGRSPELRQRLLREARAMAQLSHPNVIAIHDVGTFGDEVFLAMELVEGENLAAWLQAAPPWPRVLRAFVEAGRGLAAAHAAGLVHRDFKPANVLVGTDGRVRVTDFGLARSTSGGDGDATPAVADLSLTTTRTGAVVGTPAYMAPEQLRGAPADTRSDLFSFCVALWEALYGERPFGNDRQALLDGKVRPPPPSRRVPAWLSRAVLAGLAADPAARPASMAVLVERLDHGPWWTRRRIAAIAAGLALVASVVVLATRHRQAQPVCGDVAWTLPPATHAAMHDAFVATGRPNAAGSFTAAMGALDEYRHAWSAARHDACEATWVRGAQSPALLDLRVQCLDDRRRAASAAEALLSRADGEVVDRAAQVIAGLPSIADCSNARALQAPVPRPADTETRRAVDELGRALDTGAALGFAYKHQAALDILQPAVARARALGYAPIEARLLYQLGSVLSNAHREDEAAATLQEAALAAERAHDDAVLADAWTLLSKMVQRLGKRTDAALWSRYAETAIERIGGDDLREAARLQADAGLAWEEERFDDAQRLAVAARELAVKAAGPESFRVGQLEEVLGGVALDAGRAADALAHHRASRVIREKLFGAQHRLVGVALLNEGTDLVFLDHVDEAIPLIRRALELYHLDNPAGDDSWPHDRLAMALRRKGELAAALDEDRAGLATLERLHKTGGDALAGAHIGIAKDLLALGHAAEAKVEAERGIAIKLDAHEDDFDLAVARAVLARALDTLGDAAGARAAAAAARPRLDDYVKRLGGWYVDYVARLQLPPG